MKDELLIAWTFCANTGVPLYCADLPGCDGRTPNPATPKSDWGYARREKALPLTVNEWKQFAAYQRECGRPAFACGA